ncbi:MAG TPA: DegT/DnrJ/EryC1/StrS family aminotransferase [Methanomicrobia archaeon]|nr:DegT/DnrJ/EryC1/StrS family aminotransferase [Methanomicrobia archaeon]
MTRAIPIAKPLIGDEEARLVTEVLQSGMLAQGEYVAEFERRFARYCGVTNAVAVSNGTVALDLALKAAGIRPGDEVITPAFTFIATANAVLFQGARPIFADVDPQTCNLDPDDLLEKVTPRTRAIICVHLFGLPGELHALQEICADHQLALIEDCAQAHGADYRGHKVGSFGIGCFSFYPTKNMTTGEGGMITTSSEQSAATLRLLRNHGDSGKYQHTLLGYNHRMTNLEAAIGLAQLQKLDAFNAKRRANAAYLSQHLTAPGLNLPRTREGVTHVYHQYAVTVEAEFPLSRDELMRQLQERGIGCAIHYPLPVHQQPLYQRLGYTDDAVRCPNAAAIAQKILSLPVHPAVTPADLEYIVETINSLGNDA